MSMSTMVNANGNAKAMDAIASVAILKCKFTKSFLKYVILDN